MATPRRLATFRRHPALALLCAATALGGSLAPEARAEDMVRCRSGRLINVGMTAAEVRGRCGEPKDIVVEEVPVRAQGARGQSTVIVGVTRHERWTIDRGQGQFAAVLSFESDKLVRIDLLTSR